MDKLHHTKLKSFCTAKEALIDMKKKICRMEENIHKTLLNDKGLREEEG